MHQQDDLSAIRKHTAALEWRSSTRRALLILVLIPTIVIGGLVLLGVIMRAAEPKGPTPTNPNYSR